MGTWGTLGASLQLDLYFACIGVLILKSQFARLFLLIAIAIASPVVGQVPAAPTPAAGHITGTVTDTNGDVISGAAVVLQLSNGKDTLKLISDDNGFFDFKDLEAGAYNLTVSAPDFADWKSPALVLSPGQFVIVGDCKLRVAEVDTAVKVSYTPEEVALEEVRLEETQRVFGVIPNFYVVYDSDAPPLTTKLKFHLALKTSTDVFTVAGVGAISAINQAGDTPNYRQGWAGYGERFGAAAGDGFSDIMIGGAILPSLLHQDPRYFYKGTGTTKLRVLHAISSPFVCRGDNGKPQPNFSSIGGDLASSGLSNLYYPASNRGAGLTFENFALSTGERMLSSLVQEFVLGKLTMKHRSGN